MPAKELRADDVFDLGRDDLDMLPYGVITLDRRGVILRYNYAEATFARRNSEATVGLYFFTDVAPCTNVQGFKGRFDRFARGTDSGVDRFNFTYAFRWGSQDVSITLLRKAGRDEINMVVHRRTIALHDLAQPPSMAGTSASEPASALRAAAVPRGLAIGAREHQLSSAWHLGSAEEAAWRADIHLDDVAQRDRIARTAATRGSPYVVEYRTAAADAGAERVVVEHGTFAAGQERPGFATIVDITASRQQERDIWELAHYDPVTGLPNRALLTMRIASAASEARLTGRVAAIIALAFPLTSGGNNGLQNGTADDLLRLLGLRLGENIRGGDTVARLHDTAFVVLLTDVDSVANVAATGARILTAVEQPFVIGGRTHRLAACMGISLAPRNGEDGAALLKAAETAAFASQRIGRHAIEWFSNDLLIERDRIVRVEDDLRRALERDELFLLYQPIVDVVSRTVVATEALVRWQHPSRGLVMPDEFIKVSEEAGLVIPLGEWVLRAACKQARAWRDAGFELHMCVNVSAVQFRERNFVEVVAAILAETGVPAEMLEIELTESVMIDGFKDVIETLSNLKMIGVRLAIDDFGTGYSSLSYLKYFPVDTLKLDRAFVADIVTDTFDQAIARSVLTLAKDLGLTCIAEGIEDAQQLELLQRLGCRRMQGYYFARPQLASALEGRLGVAW